MSKTGQWVLEMQEAAEELLSHGGDPDSARKVFIDRYPGQQQFFDDCLAHLDGEQAPSPGV